MTVTIEQKTSYLMMYSAEVNGKWHSLNRIVIYEGNNIIAQTAGGWFEPLPPRRRLNGIEIDTDKILKRLVEKFDGKVFIIKDKTYWDNARNPQYILYIPNELAEFRRVSRFMSFHHVVCDRYESEKLEARIDYYRPELKVNEQLTRFREEFNKLKDSHSFAIDNRQLNDMIDVLDSLHELYQEEVKRLENMDLSDL